MKRFFYLVAAAAVAGMVISCENEPKNPGDFSKATTLAINGQVVSLVTGKTYDLKVADERDTVYKYLYVLKDTLRTVEGTDTVPVIGPDGKPIVNDDSVYVYSKITARFIEMEPIYLPAEPDTFSFNIESNARWLAGVPSVPDKCTTWYFNHNSTTTGGGDSHVEFRTILNRSKIRVNAAYQEVLTSDSAIMYRIPFFQYGRSDQPADL